jgi:hypothetical protein
VPVLVWSGLAEAGTKISRMRTGLPRNGPPEHAIGALRNASGGTPSRLRRTFARRADEIRRGLFSQGIDVTPARR